MFGLMPLSIQNAIKNEVQLATYKFIITNNKSRRSQGRTEKPRGEIIRLIYMLKLVQPQYD